MSASRRSAYVVAGLVIALLAILGLSTIRLAHHSVVEREARLFAQYSQQHATILGLQVQADIDRKQFRHILQRNLAKSNHFFIKKNNKPFLQSRFLSKDLAKYQRSLTARTMQTGSSGLISLARKNYVWSTVTIANTPFTLTLFRRSEASYLDAFSVFGLFIVIDSILIIGLLVWGLKQFIDITGRQNQQENKEAILQAMHDPLTGLPNRSLLYDRLHQAIGLARRDKKSIALLIMDLDRFKEINNTLGHDYGDHILKMVEPRLREVIRDSDTISRLGDDEFAIVLPIAHMGSVTRCVDKILHSLHRPLSINEIEMVMGIEASIGIAMFPNHGEDAETLVRKAEIAMHKAKAQNTQIAFYTPKDDPHSLRRLSLISDLRQAIKNDELALHYQPKVDLRSNRIVSVEALLRWKHQKHHYIPPTEFIPLAEQSGVIKPLTQWVLKQAIQQYKEWRKMGITLNVAVNLSARNLQDRQIIQDIMQLLDESEMEPAHLELEITESAMMLEPQQAMSILQSLNQLGIKLSIDDFGTGYSSLAYLKNLPVNNLKIDKSFVINMLNEKSNDIIVHSTIKLAHGLGCRVIAEGVEDEETLETLTRFGCNAAQGYYICRPLPVEELNIWFKESPWLLMSAA